MLEAGLVSVTLRALDVDQVLRLAAETGLRAIEWGGDMHVPPGNRRMARRVGEKTQNAGCRVVSYGSYYVAGGTPRGKQEFGHVLAAATALGAPVIRVWAGCSGTDRATPGDWKRVVEDTRRIAAMAACEGIGIAFEYHEDSLTDTQASAVRLMREISIPGVRCCWQEVSGRQAGVQTGELSGLMPWLAHVHVNGMLGGRRNTLEEGINDWRRYLEVLRTSGEPRALLLEFVRGHEPEQLRRDAEILHALIHDKGERI